MIRGNQINAVHAAPAGGQVSLGPNIQAYETHARVDYDGPTRRREHLFEPFFGEGEGHGLGLWVTYQLVQQLNEKSRPTASRTTPDSQSRCH